MPVKKGFKHSEETKRKMSEARKGNKNALGSKHTEETRKKYSLSRMGNTNAKGHKHTEKSKQKMSLVKMGNQSGLGYKHTEESKQKMSKSQKGRKHSEETIKKMSLIKMGNQYTLGFKHSEESKRKISVSISGSNHYNWQGGIDNEEYCDAWADKEYKESIRERDNHTCQNPKCYGVMSKQKLTVHHIDYVKKNCHPKNLITLCNSCNSRANFNRGYWKNLYRRILDEK